jgi:RNA polymerase sigma-70 factor (ECF subfamily)
MKRLLIAVAVVVASCGSAWCEEPSVASLPPVVVKTIPQAGDTKVDPAVAEIQVAFSKKMTNGSWSWAGADESWVTGKPHYLADHKTCVLPVKLEPGKTYVVWINSPSFQNFKDAGGQSSLPYLLVFETAKRKADKRPTGARP